MKKIIRYIAVLLLTFTAGCNSWLDIVPEDQRVSQDYWNTKEDVANTTVSCYVSLRDCLLKMVQWGELRGNGLNLGAKITEPEREIRELNITSENDIVQWKEFYKVINTANSVLKYAPEVMMKDPTFKKEEYEAFRSENIFIRSLCYFYLVRAFGEIPLICEPYLTDDQSYQQPKVSERIVLDSLIRDLEGALPGARLEFAANNADMWQNKARGTRWAMLALLADIYLWDGQYEKVVFTCDRIMKTGPFGLVKKEEWFQNFYPGNTVEIISHLYFDQPSGQKNDMYKWFSESGSIRYALAASLVNRFKEETGDIRGVGGTYYEEESAYKIWKYLGVELVEGGGEAKKRASNNRSPHWIFYRYADVLLMKSEALMMKEEGNEVNYAEAMRLLNRVRERAGAELLTEAEIMSISEENFLKLILSEREKEFAGEGKSWFDILRMGKRDMYKYRKMMIDVLLESVSIENRPIYETKLSNEYGYFFPIHYDEIQSSGGILTQNPFYLK